MIDSGLVQVLVRALSRSQFKVENNCVAGNTNFRSVQRNVTSDNGVTNIAERVAQTLKNLFGHVHNNISSKMYRELVPLVIWLLGCLGVSRVNNQATTHELGIVQLLHCSRGTLIVLELHKSVQQTFAA